METRFRFRSSTLAARRASGPTAAPRFLNTRAPPCSVVSSFIWYQSKALSSLANYTVTVSPHPPITIPHFRFSIHEGHTSPKIYYSLTALRLKWP